MDGLERIKTELVDLRKDIRKQIQEAGNLALPFERLQDVRKAAQGLVDELDENIKKYGKK